MRLQLRWAAACDGVGAASSQAKAYLAAVAVWLFAQDAREAWACYQACRPPALHSLHGPLSVGWLGGRLHCHTRSSRSRLLSP